MTYMLNKLISKSMIVWESAPKMERYEVSQMYKALDVHNLTQVQTQSGLGLNQK